MVNFDVYKNNPKAAATLIAREGTCRACPICAKCGSELVHDYDRCYKTWSRFFESNGEALRRVGGFSKLLSIMIDCDKCTLKKMGECDLGEVKDCSLIFCRWLCSKFINNHEFQQVELKWPNVTDNCERTISFNGNFLKKLARAQNKIEPDKDYTLAELGRLLRDSENEVERN